MSLGKEIGIDTMEYRPVCVYLNGKYYGFMALFEDYSPTYFETNYNLPADGITCINGAAKVDGQSARLGTRQRSRKRAPRVP